MSFNTHKNSEAKKVELLGLTYDNVDLDEAVCLLEGFVQSKKPHYCCSTAAELIVRSQKEHELRAVYQAADLLTLDGQVGVWAARFLGRPAKAHVGTAKLALRFFEKNHQKDYRYYLLGAKPESVERAVDNLRKQYPDLHIVGYHHGYFKDALPVYENIKKCQPDILLVGMSSPFKERVMVQNASMLGVPVVVGCGGAIDIMAGYCKLAPEWVTNLGLEWLYRLIQEPKRLWKRYLVTNTLFIALVARQFLREKWKRRVV